MCRCFVAGRGVKQKSGINFGGLVCRVQTHCCPRFGMQGNIVLLVYCCWQGSNKMFNLLPPFPYKVSCLKPEGGGFVPVSVGLN
jgi:hypothetical protein